MSSVELESPTGTKCCVNVYGATVTNWMVRQRNGDFCDIIVGCDGSNGMAVDDKELAGYYFGCVVGRVANRIRAGKFQLDGREYQLHPRCSNGHHLHGGGALSRTRWHIVKQSTAAVTLAVVSPHLENGYPASVEFQVTFELLSTSSCSDSSLSITYEVRHLDGPATPVNPTSHLYFNLNPSQSTVLRHLFHAPNASHFLETDGDLLPTGQIVSLADEQALDFRTRPKSIGRDIQVLRSLPHKGYDHYFILSDANDRHNHQEDKLREACSLSCPESGQRLTVETTSPGFQIYTANYFDNVPAKQAHRQHGLTEYGENRAIAIETHCFPDAINWPQWRDSVLLLPGGTFHSRTIYTVTSENQR